MFTHFNISSLRPFLQLELNYCMAAMGSFMFPLKMPSLMLTCNHAFFVHICLLLKCVYIFWGGLFVCNCLVTGRERNPILLTQRAGSVLLSWPPGCTQ